MKISCSNLSQSYAAVLGQPETGEMNKFTFSVDATTGEVDEIVDGFNREPCTELQEEFPIRMHFYSGS